VIRVCGLGVFIFYFFFEAGRTLPGIVILGDGLQEMTEVSSRGVNRVFVNYYRSREAAASNRIMTYRTVYCS
jgi:hypothetical protein